MPAVIEAIFSIIVAIIEALVSMIGAVFEAIAGLFAVGGQALSVGEAFMLLCVLAAEVLCWVMLGIVELILALFAWRKPRKVFRHVFWRPRKRDVQTGPSDSGNT